MNLRVGKAISDWLIKLGLEETYAIWLKDTIFFIAIIVVSIIIDLIAKRIILKIIAKLAAKTKTTWDDALVERKVFNRLSHIAAALVIYLLAPLALQDYDIVLKFIIILTKVYMAFIVMLVIDSFLNASHDIYLTYEASKTRPIKGYIQVIKIIINIIGGIIILSILLNKTPIYFLGGLGAITAILILVFKDTILGFVGSIQLSANDMLRPGDWITMSKYEADGTVIEMSLTTVKVQNFDKSVTTIPTYSFISDSFHNWRAMEEAGLRRIKRSINIDITSIKFCDDEMLNRFLKMELVKDLISTHQTINSDAPCQSLTNLGIFKEYIQNYLKQIPEIKRDLTFLIRQQQTTEKGLPIEIYVFADYSDFNRFEDLQFSIFEHVLSVVNTFDLKIFQNPTEIGIINK